MTKKPATPSRYTEIVIPPIVSAKKKLAGTSPLVSGTSIIHDPLQDDPSSTPSSKPKKHRRHRSREAMDDISTTSSSSQEDDLSRSMRSGRSQPLRPTDAAAYSMRMSQAVDEDDDDEEGDDPTPGAICLARDSMFQTKYNFLQRSPVKSLPDEDLDDDHVAVPAHLARDSLQIPRVDVAHSNEGSTETIEEPSTPPHSLIQPRASFLAGDDENSIRQLNDRQSYLMRPPSFYDTTTTLSPTPAMIPSPYTPGTPSSFGTQSPSPEPTSPEPQPIIPGISRTHFELWMTTWIQEYLEIDAEYIDVFQIRLPTDDNPLTDASTSKSQLLHLLIDDLSLSQFKKQKTDFLHSIAELLSAPVSTLKVLIRQVTDRAILISFWLPPFCCARASEMASLKNRQLLSYGVAMVINNGRRVWCGQDRVGKGSILSKLKQKLRSDDDRKFYEHMEISLDRVAMELWYLVRPIEKPAWHSAVAGNVDMLRMLVSINCDLEEGDQDGNTPLHVCSQLGHVNALCYLLDHGASLNARNKMHMTALHWAANQGNAGITRILLQSGADINAIEQRHHATPLHVACMMGHADVVQVLVEFGADLAAVDKHHNTGLHLGILFAPVDPQEDIAKAELYADIVEMLLGGKVQASPCGVAWVTPLHLACANGQEYLVEILLKYGANVNALDQELWQTPLHYAVMAEHTSVAELLVIAGANVSVSDKNGNSALDLAETVALTTVLEIAQRDAVLESDGMVSPTGPTLCIVGDSGSGKSSLIQSLCSSLQRRQSVQRVHNAVNSDSDESVTFDTATQRFNCFWVNLCPDVGVILRDVPASVQHHLPHCCYLGNKTSLFVVMLNAADPYDDQIRSVNTWLELVAFSCMAVAVRPTVILVTSHADKRSDPTSFVLSDRTVNRLADRYDGVLNLSRRMHILNCRTPYSSAVTSFVDDVIVEASELMRTCKIPKLCNDVAQLLPELQCQYAVPIVEFELFERLVRQQLPDISVDQNTMRYVASYLHDLGQLVYVHSKEDGPVMIVLEPDWLCWDGFGRLMRPTSPEQDTVNPAITAAAGKVSEVGLQKLFSMVPCGADVLVQLLRFCAMCLPILDHYQLTATMLGTETATASATSSARQRCWRKDPQFVRYAGRRWSMEGGQPFPLSVVSWLQVACADHVSEEVLATMATWRIGFKMAVESGVAEALVELTPDRRYLQLLVRCVKDARQQCAILLQHMTNMIIDTLSSDLRGIETELAAISPRQLRAFTLLPGEHYDAVPFDTALGVYRAFLRGQSAAAQSIAEQNAQPQRGAQMVASFINIGGKLEKLADVLLLDEGDIRLIAQSVFGRELCERLLAHQFEELRRDFSDAGEAYVDTRHVSPLDVDGMPATLRQAATALQVPAMPLLWQWMAQPWLGMLRRWQGRRHSSWIRMQQALSILTESVVTAAASAGDEIFVPPESTVC